MDCVTVGASSQPGAAGFLLLIQCRERPETLGEPSRFDTTPSSPSLQAWRRQCRSRTGHLVLQRKRADCGAASPVVAALC
jgi:hypothetical protein